jgi:DNA mismatch repair protein MutS
MADVSVTPMLRQYLEIKKDYPGTLLFFRLGDFYELFNEDAIVGSKALEITLTARQKDSANPIPMCGVPHHAAANYIAKLIKKGFRVAICEQTEEAGKGKKLVKREVVRVITPGTAIDPQLMDARENIFLGSICGSGDTFGAAFLDVSTGDFFATMSKGPDSWSKICSDIQTFSPKELLFPDSLKTLVESTFGGADTGFLPAMESDPLASGSSAITTLTPQNDWAFHTEDCSAGLKAQFRVKELTAFGLGGKDEAIRAAGACLRYAQQTQRASAQHIAEVRYFETTDFMVLDPVTMKNLEVIESRGEFSRRSLLGILDETVTGMGARLLRSWLLRPLVKRSEIQTRLTAVSELCDSMLRDKLRFLLKEVSDIERLVGRLSLGTASARDLLGLNRSLRQIPEINHSLSDVKSLLLQVLSENIHDLPEVADLIERSISDSPPLNISDGGTIKAGFSAELDELRGISTSAKQIIAGFEERERERTGIQNLRIKFNNVFGYFIEISKGNASRAPEDYERRQTLTNAERFTTPQLKEWEQKVLGAESRIIELETELFGQVRAEIAKEIKRLQSTARALATLDVLQGLAEAAVHRNYTNPLLHDGDQIEVKSGRHPIVEAFSREPFIPNDLFMNNSTDRLLIITGPNMGGKSTVLRQTALIQIMAQLGSFVPAASARLPILDRVWTRVGASDDLSSGRSTFMVEMTETAAILHNATPRSLILLDEIGRGTSTFDGLSIAWAVAEYLHDSPEHSAKTLFATHYHELTELAEKLAGARNYQITATEKDGEVVFLHRLEPGKASKSYGIAVAQLAGLPIKAVSRAKEVLERLEKYELAVFSDNDQGEGLDKAARKASKARAAAQVSLFAITNESVVDRIREVEIGEMSDGDAKALLKELKSQIV